MCKVKERGSTHIYKVNRISPEEINGMTKLCVAEQPPYCSAACPLKLDVRAMIGYAAKGQFSKALQIYEKATPFPSLLSSECEAPCVSRCKMGELGDAIAIRDLEKAIVAYGEHRRSGGVFRSQKKQTVAVFGEDYFTFFLAGELEKKMYPTTVYTTLPDLDAYLTKLNAQSEKDRLNLMELDFVFSTEISRDLFESYDVVCASEAAAKKIFPDAVCNENYMVFEAENLVMGKTCGVLQSAADAKKAALSVDRLAQHLHPGNMRGAEGAVETSLYTNTEGVTEVTAVPVTDRESAVAEAGRCLLCHCDECMKACAFLRHFEKKPGLIGREIYNNTQIIMGTHPLNHAMNACTLCGQCKEVCPNGFDMATICQHARSNMVSTDKMPLSQHEFALLDMFFSNEEAFLARPQPGFENCRYVFFPGCQAGAIAPDTVNAAYLDLTKRLEGGVALMLGCCNILAKWSGRDELYAQQKAFLKQEMEHLGNPVVIAGCPMCKKELSEDYETVGIWDILLKIGLPENVPLPCSSMALHDSCGARGDEATHKAVRELASKLHLTLSDLPYQEDESPCCGYGGLTAYADRQVASEITDQAVSQSDAPLLTYCMGCRDRFSRKGHPSYHILELIYGTGTSALPDISEKRYNRLQLKADLLKQVWGETMKQNRPDFRVEYTDEALKLMDDRFILKDDVEQVLRHVKETNECIYDTDSGLYSACFRPGNVTFWVSFEPTDDGYRVHRAWSHRMLIQFRED